MRQCLHVLTRAIHMQANPIAHAHAHARAIRLLLRPSHAQPLAAKPNDGAGLGLCYLLFVPLFYLICAYY